MIRLGSCRRMSRLALLLLLLSTPALAKTYDLAIKKQNVFITGKAVEAITINDSIPGPTLEWQEGEGVVVNVTNLMDEETSIHWHGILLDGAMDGVPGLNGFHGIAPGTTFTYRFKIRQAGTYWYHSHSNLQEQMGMYGALVINPSSKGGAKMSKPGSPYLEGSSRRVSATKGVHQDHVVLLSDFIQENPNAVLNNLKIDSGYYNYNKRTLSSFLSDVKNDGFWTALSDYMVWGDMRMDPTDLSDVTNYTFLINGKKDWSALFKKGEKIKLRFVNAAAMTIFDLSIPGLQMKLIEADGQPVKPVVIDELRIAPAETYDVIIEPKTEDAYTIFAESLDRTGHVAASLAPREGMVGEVPKMRPRAQLTMADMPNMTQTAKLSDQEILNENEDGERRVYKNIQSSSPSHLRQNFAASEVGALGHVGHMHEGMGESGWDKHGTPAGNKALEYSDLTALTPQKDLREPTREIEFKFGGTMNRYIWTINGEKFPQPIHLKLGERVRLKFINETMMAHPIHLHGMFMQLENRREMKWLPNKHTVVIPPAQTVTTLLTADEAGEWAFHCHLLFHMASGMMSSITVDKSTLQESQTKGMKHGENNQIHHSLIAEADIGEARDGAARGWDLDGWIGGDMNRLWLKSEHKDFGKYERKLEAQALYSRNVAPFWDLQFGARHDFKTDFSNETVHYLTLGVEGLAPQWFETDAHIFVSNQGNWSARLKQEVDIFLTQRLIAQPYFEADFFAQNIPKLEVKSGLAELELGVATRYEISRKFAPYFALRYHKKTFGTASLAKQIGERVDNFIAAAGVRVRF